MFHNFENSLLHERQQTSMADAFYHDVMHVSELQRFNSDSDADMEMQRQDVDLLLTLNGITYRVSEKFRDKDFGDLYVEVFGKYPDTYGWILTGSPNAILYFTPKKVYWITHKSLAEFCHKTLFPLIPPSWYQQIYSSPKTIISKQLLLSHKFIKISIIKAHNHPTKGKDWDTIGISIPFSVLSVNGVKIKQFELNN